MSFSSSNFEIWGCLVNFGFENIKENRFPFLPGHPVASTPHTLAYTCSPASAFPCSISFASLCSTATAA
jgi:hypothetical protein